MVVYVVTNSLAFWRGEKAKAACSSVRAAIQKRSPERFMKRADGEQTVNRWFGSVSRDEQGPGTGLRR